MLVRLSVHKLAAAGIAPLRVTPKFRSELLRSGATWPQDVNYLRDTYMQVFELWSSTEQGTTPAYSPEADKRLYEETAPKLHELILGLDGVSKSLSERSDVTRTVQNAQHDLTTAESYGRIGDHAMATVYQSYALSKAHRLLDGLTLEANKKSSIHVQAYGYDVSGEIGEVGEQESRSPNLWDQGNSPKFDRTPINPANQLVDAEAEEDYPNLKEIKHKRVEWPARTR